MSILDSYLEQAAQTESMYKMEINGLCDIFATDTYSSHSNRNYENMSNEDNYN